MVIVVDIFWLIFMASEFFILAGTFCYLKREYSKAATASNEKNNVEKSSRPQKTSSKRPIKSNETQPLNIQDINNEIGYAQLFFYQNGQQTYYEKMSKEKLVIGRDPRSDIQIKERTVSRRQCLISKRDEKFVLKNYSDKNVTRINGNIVNTKAELKYGDVVKMGNTTFLFESTTVTQPSKQMYK